MNDGVAFVVGVVTGGLLTGWLLALRVVLTATTRRGQ